MAFHLKIRPTNVFLARNIITVVSLSLPFSTNGKKNYFTDRHLFLPTRPFIVHRVTVHITLPLQSHQRSGSTFSQCLVENNREQFPQLGRRRERERSIDREIVRRNECTLLFWTRCTLEEGEGVLGRPGETRENFPQPGF